MAERGLHDLDDAWIVATQDTPVPYAPTLEDAYMPDAEAITAVVRARLGLRSVPDLTDPPGTKQAPYGV